MTLTVEQITADPKSCWDRLSPSQQIQAYPTFSAIREHYLTKLEQMERDLKWREHVQGINEHILSLTSARFQECWQQITPENRVLYMQVYNLDPTKSTYFSQWGELCSKPCVISNRSHEEIEAEWQEAFAAMRKLGWEG